MSRHQPTSARFRVAVAMIMGLLAALATGWLSSWRYAPLIGWDIAALVFAVWIWVTVWPMDSRQTEAHAEREDPTRPASDGLLILASIASLGAVGLVIAYAASREGLAALLLAALGVISIIVSWFTVHTVYMLRYARLYYGPSPNGGVDFNDHQPPRYSDFAYLAFTIGMTFQVSDTELQTPGFRATALRHALLSYLFGTGIVATTINLIAGLGK